MGYEEIKKLIDEMGKAEFDELNVEFPDGVKISMKKHTTSNKKCDVVSVDTINVNSQDEIQNIKVTNQNIDENLKTVKSPMVGTFYNSPSPDKEPFVKVGDRVKKGQVLCIIEAMKLMNEIESEYDGEIVEICAENEGIVEYGMPLFKIK